MNEMFKDGELVFSTFLMHIYIYNVLPFNLVRSFLFSKCYNMSLHIERFKASEVRVGDWQYPS